MDSIRNRWVKVKVRMAASFTALVGRIEECQKDVLDECGQKIEKFDLTQLVAFSCYSAPRVRIGCMTYVPPPNTSMDCRLVEAIAWCDQADALTGDHLRLKADALLITASM